MTKPESFTSTSDYATVKNDANGSASFTLPGSTNIDAGATYTNETTLTLGANVSIVRGQIYGSRENLTFVSNLVISTRTGTSSGSPSPYSLVALINRVSATEVKCGIEIYNPYGATLTTQSGDETFSFNIYTFLSPFA